jgi:hypothetical protein
MLIKNALPVTLLLYASQAIANEPTATPIPKFEHTGYPEYGAYSRYQSKVVCDGYLSDDDLRQGTKIFIANNTPDNIRNVVKSAVANNPKYAIVTDSLDADFLFDSLYVQVTNKQNHYRRETSTTPGTDDGSGDPSRTSGATTSSELVYAGSSKSVVDRHTFAVYAIRHPASEKETGLICNIFMQDAFKGRKQRVGQDPLKKLTDKLSQFFAYPNSNWYAPYMTKAFREQMKRQGI